MTKGVVMSATRFERFLLAMTAPVPCFVMAAIALGVTISILVIGNNHFCSTIVAFVGFMAVGLLSLWVRWGIQDRQDELRKKREQEEGEA